MDRREFLVSSFLCAASPVLPLQVPDTLTLVERFSRLSAALPRLALTRLPTPVTRAWSLGERICVPQLYVKRDDLACSVYAGSKVRKLEFALGEARAFGCTHLVTGGSVGSHHALATALHGKAQGFSVELLLLPEPISPEACRVVRASTHFADRVEYVPSARDLSRRWQAALGRHQPSSYSIPLGGTSPLCNVAYVEAALELERQVIAGELPEPARIYVPLGTMGCAVGLTLGLQLTRLRSQVVAVRASNPGTSSTEKFRQLCAATNDWLRSKDPRFPELPMRGSDVIIDGRQLGRGYALPTESGRHAQSLAHEAAQLELELTYTAKTLAAIIADAPRLGGRPVLLWNTHGGMAPDCPPALDRTPEELLSYVATSSGR
jgi:D-cysteine desulfhydrase